MSDKPPIHNQFMNEFPAVAAAYEQLGEAVYMDGPLDTQDDGKRTDLLNFYHLPGVWVP